MRPPINLGPDCTFPVQTWTVNDKHAQHCTYCAHHMQVEPRDSDLPRREHACLLCSRSKPFDSTHGGGKEQGRRLLVARHCALARSLPGGCAKRRIPQPRFFLNSCAQSQSILLHRLDPILLYELISKGPGPVIFYQISV